MTVKLYSIWLFEQGDWDLLVWAENPTQALEFWEEFYGLKHVRGPLVEQTDSETFAYIVEVPTTNPKPGAVHWSDIPRWMASITEQEYA